MNYFDKNKILSAAVVLLLMINLGILGLLWFERSPKTPPDRLPPPPMDGRHPSEKMPPEGGPKEFLIRELKLNDKQTQDFGKLVEEHQADMRKLRDRIRNEKARLWDNISKSGSETGNTDSIASEIANDQKQIELVTFRHFQKVRELCDDTQKKKFDEVIKEALNMMGPNNPPPGQR